MKRVFTLLILLIYSVHSCWTQSWTINDLLPNGYDLKKTPNPNGTTTVNISAIVNSLVAVTESDQSFQLDLTLKLRWFEDRLNFSEPLTQYIEAQNETNNDLILDSSFVTNFWIPDIYFQNGRSSSIVNSGFNIQYLVIGINKDITYTVRLNAILGCKMDLTPYPQDYQYCSVEAVSMTQTSDVLVLNWEELVTDSANYPKFRIRKSYVGECSPAFNNGNFSCRSATLKLVRRVGYYMIRVYAPTFLSVIISFVGFWIPVMGWPARVAIIVGPLFALITQDVSLNNDINVAYVVAIHWWMIWCQIFIYFVLLEYAVAISWAHFVNEKKALKATEAGQKGIKIVEGYYFGNKGLWALLGKYVDNILHAFFGKVDYHKDPLMRNKVDYCARVAFLFMWFVYCLLYIFSTICPWAVIYNL